MIRVLYWGGVAAVVLAGWSVTAWKLVVYMIREGF